MAPRKNTAQTFEVLYRISQEEAAKRKGKKPEEPKDSTTASPTPIGPESRPGAIPAIRVDRAPLLAEENPSEPSTRPTQGRSRPRQNDLAREAASTAPERRSRAVDRRARISRSERSPASPVAGGAPHSNPVRLETNALTAQAHEDLVAAQERAALLSDRVVEAWVEPLRSSVDPALLSAAPREEWEDASRVRFLRAEEPVTERAEAAVLSRGVSGSLRESERSFGSGEPVLLDTARNPGVATPALESATKPEILLAPETAHPSASLPPFPEAPVLPLDAGGEPTSPGQRASPRWVLPRRVAAWVVGEGSTRFLEQRVELRVSTLCVTIMGLIVVTTLVLTYLRMPGEEDSLFRSQGKALSWASDSSSASPADPRASPTAAEAPAPEAVGSVPGESSESSPVAKAPSSQTNIPARPPQARRFPLWSPGTSVPTPGGGSLRSPEPFPELRNATTEAAAPDTRVADAPAPSGSASERDSVSSRPKPGTEPEAGSSSADATSETFYVIQVRAKESREGAQRILDYLSLFGFENPFMREDSRGDQHSHGETLHTVFVGRFSDRTEADRECARLKRETRARPYKNRPDFFGDCLVITRTRG